jgi:hypothetical protein
MFCIGDETALTFNSLLVGVIGGVNEDTLPT